MGRLAAQVSVDIRYGRMKREQAMELVEWRDGLFPEEYMGVSVNDVLKNIDMTRAKLLNVMDRFTTWELFDGEKDGRPRLKEFA